MEKNKSDKKESKKDLIIKFLLIIVIILLLLHNCVLLNKRKIGKTPSGNVNIIEITCVDNDKCDVTDKQNGSNNKNDSISTDEEIVEIDNTSDSNNNTNSNTNTRRNNRTNNNANNSSSNNNTNNNTTTSDTTEDTTEPDGEVFIKDKKLIWNDSSDLKIFTNSVYTLENKISPESSNTYQFVVKNSTAYKIKYNISFVETNPYNINMKYKLKKNNTYIVDHYVSYNQLNISDQLLNAKNNDTFYLDWKWISSDHDNAAGENKANYSLKIEVNAESV